jgi:hypothetical protein
MLSFKKYMNQIEEAAATIPSVGAVQSSQTTKPPQTTQASNQPQVNQNDPVVQNLKKKIITDPAVAKAKATGNENEIQKAVDAIVSKDPAANAKFGKQVDQSDRYIANAFRAMGAGRQR